MSVSLDYPTQATDAASLDRLPDAEYARLYPASTEWRGGAVLAAGGVLGGRRGLFWRRGNAMRLPWSKKPPDTDEGRWTDDDIREYIIEAARDAARQAVMGLTFDTGATIAVDTPDDDAWKITISR